MTLGCHGQDHMVVGYTNTCAISAIKAWIPLMAKCTLSTLCDKVCQWFV
jgi:hypothetical protein